MKALHKTKPKKDPGHVVLTLSVAGRTVRIHIHPDESGGYWVDSPTLRGLVTEGDSLDEAVENAMEAAALLIET